MEQNMKIKRTLCGVSLAALLAVGIAVFAGFPAHLEGQDENSQARSPDVNDLFVKRAALLNDSDDFNKMLQSLGTSSPNLMLESDIANAASVGNVLVEDAIWFLGVYEKMQCEPDRFAAKGALKNRLAFYSKALGGEADVVVNSLSFEKSPAMTQTGFRIRDDLRAAKDKMDALNASLK
jgi:hypothetical protein